MCLACKTVRVAPAAGIVISRNVHDAVDGRLRATFHHLGSLTLKNIERPIQAFEVKWDASNWKVSDRRAYAAID